MPRITNVVYYRVKPRWLMVKITDENGEFGWGEATLEGHDLAVEGCLEEMIPRIVGKDANEIENIWQLFWRHGFYRGGPVFMSALSGVDIALWDLKGKNLKVPVYELLGGKVRNEVQVYCWIGGDRPSDVESAAKARLAQGLKCVKMNATEDLNWVDSPSSLDAAVERLKIVKSLGLDAGLDFHGRVHKAMAKQLAKAYQATFPPHHNPHRPRRKIIYRWDVKRFLEDASIDILQPDVAHAGGISETKRIATMAEAYDVAIAPHCPLGPVAFAACVHIALSSPNFTILEMSLGMHYNTESGDDIDLLTYLKDPSVFDIGSGGYVKAPTGYGLGIDIDEEMVKKISKETLPWQCKVFHGPDGSIREWSSLQSRYSRDNYAYIHEALCLAKSTCLCFILALTVVSQHGPQMLHPVIGYDLHVGLRTQKGPDDPRPRGYLTSLMPTPHQNSTRGSLSGNDNLEQEAQDNDCHYPTWSPEGRILRHGSFQITPSKPQRK
ncbi:hypothetical protein CIB48_g2301 [Xylaria polymorpha]|nr:hypothetical protein CIB48_g2301 [Xylaria polymorpha]